MPAFDVSRACLTCLACLAILPGDACLASDTRLAHLASLTRDTRGEMLGPFVLSIGDGAVGRAEELRLD